MASPPRRSGLDDPETTNPRSQPVARPPDDQATRAVEGMAPIAELRAALGTQGAGGAQTLPLFAMPDAIIVGRGTASDWQLEDTSLSRKHAQFRWNGRELTVEDLGSANGTRVNGRPARNPTPVKPGDTVQLGTVIITLALTAPLPSQDDQATRMVAQADVGLPPLSAQATVVRAPAPSPAGAGDFAERARNHQPHAQQLFTPERDFAGPDEQTRAWDPRAALVRAPDRAIDAELADKLKTLWREKRRTLVLAGAAAWVAVLLIVWAAFEKGPTIEDVTASQTAKAKGSQKPVVTQLAPPKSPSPTANTAAKDPTAAAKDPNTTAKDPNTTAKDPTLPTTKNPETTAVAGQENEDSARTNAADPATIDRDDQLERAVAAYDQGRMQEALGLWKHLAADGKDATAKFMVELIESRLGSGATP